MKDSVSSAIINHEGIVQKINDKTVIVSISAATACSGCHAEGSCTLSGKEEKIIEVSGRYNVKPGDTVNIIMRQSLGFAALFLGYIMPLISVLTTLIIMISFKVPEVIAGVSSLAILIPYYVILFFFRERINEKFTFTLKV